MNKIKRSGKLMKAAFAVLFREKKLLLFPLVASTLVLGVALFFIMPIVLYPTGHSVFTAEHWSALGGRASHWFNLDQAHQQPVHSRTDAFTSGMRVSSRLLTGHPVTAAVFALLYFVSMFFATFCNVAFYHEIMQALNGHAVSIRRGYRFACARWRAVLLWSLFAGLVGYLIQMIQERVGFLGRIVTGLIGFAWSTACIFIIPTLVRDTETSNPLKLLRNSVGTLRNTWGELVIGFVGLELLAAGVILTVVLGGLAIVVVGAAAIDPVVFKHYWPVMTVIIVLTLLIAFLLSWISSIVNPVYRSALYIYATEGVVPGTFDQELLDSAWKVK